jgi:nicotinamide riboside transporter PnuC
MFFFFIIIFIYRMVHFTSQIQLLKSVMQMAGGFLWSRGTHDSDSIVEDTVVEECYANGRWFSLVKRNT